MHAIGRSCYDDDATQEKIDYELLKANRSTTHTVGFRFIGWKVVDSAGNVVSEKGKKWGQQVVERDVLVTLREFFGGDGARVVDVERVLGRVRDMLTWFQTQRTHHFRASSLLIVYDAAANRAADCHLIDFDHVVNMVCPTPLHRTSYR
mmetsp:Transcript_69919/g.164532  ORF Transcript_69919/g.164532 Transcript_69919/m.164532 type:complete len:149 (-) Transcript_69919:15-461(-)